MMTLIGILAVLFATLAILLPILEKYGKEPSEEKLQKLSRWIIPLVGLAIVLSAFRFFME